MLELDAGDVPGGRRPDRRRRDPAEPADPQRRGGRGACATRRSPGRRTPPARRRLVAAPASPGRAAGSQERLQSVEIGAPPAVTLSSADGNFAATVTNGLDQPVTVARRRRASDGGVDGRRRRADRAGPDEPHHDPAAGAHDRGRRAQRHAARSPTSTARRSDRRIELPIRSGQVSEVIWVIIGAGVGAALRRDRCCAWSAGSGQPPSGPPSPPRPPTRSRHDRRWTAAGDAARHPRQQRGDGRRDRRLPAQRLRPLDPAGRGARRRAARRPVHHRQHVPNMLYILLAGGVFNAVLVPAAGAVDEERHRRRRRRTRTGSSPSPCCSSATVTVLLVVAAPWVMDAAARQRVRRPGAGRAAAVGHRLRALLPAAGLLLRDVRAGRADPQRPRPVRPDDVGADRQQRHRGRRAGRLPGRRSARRPTTEQVGAFTTAQELLLGLGSTVGIVAQFLILVPYLRAAGVRLRPRFDFRDTGLGHTLRLARLDGAVRDRQPGRVRRRGAAGLGRHRGPAATAPASPIYSTAFLIVMVPHSIITVSLATAILPRLSAQAADERPRRAGADAGQRRCAAPRRDRPVRALLPVIAD